MNKINSILGIRNLLLPNPDRKENQEKRENTDQERARDTMILNQQKVGTMKDVKIEEIDQHLEVDSEEAQEAPSEAVEAPS